MNGKIKFHLGKITLYCNYFLFFYFLCNMSLYFSSLNSGSNGNCYFIGNHKDAVLVDAGITCKEVERRLKSMDLSIKSIRAIFISHEHIDHIKGIEILVKRHNIPIYFTPKTYENSRLKITNENKKYFNPLESIEIGSLKIKAFPKSHDAIDPCSFIIKHEEHCVGVFTDIGNCCNHVIEHFKLCNAVFLEANYDQAMLENGTYPYHLKKRISGNEGHLSNEQALELFLNHSNENLEHLLLSHLSQENNDPELLMNLFNSKKGKTNIHIASRHKPTPLFKLGVDKKMSFHQIKLFS